MIVARTIVALCVTASLAAWGLQAAPQAAAAPQTGKPGAGAAPSQSVVAPSGQVDAATLIGRWGDNGDCTKDIFFRDDRTFRSYTGGSGTWSISGDMLTMSGSGGTFVVRVQSLNDSQLLITNPDGSVGASQRC